MILSQLTGSLWDPNITACKKNETTVEVNFTTSPLGNRYMALIQNTTVIGTSYVLEVLFSPSFPQHHPRPQPSALLLLLKNADFLARLSFGRARAELSAVQICWAILINSDKEKQVPGSIPGNIPVTLKPTKGRGLRSME